MGVTSSAKAVAFMNAAADYLAPGAIETQRYQAEIFDMCRRRMVLGQRIQQTQATGNPSRYFEQVAIPTASAVPLRQLTTTPSEPRRVERPVSLKAIAAGINYGIVDTEVNRQQGQFAYLEAKDLQDTVNAVLKFHDQRLWTGSDTDLVLPATDEYCGISGQIVQAPVTVANAQVQTISSTGSLVDGVKTLVANMAARLDFEVQPTAIYVNPLLQDLFDKEAKAIQLAYNEVEVIPGVIVKSIPTTVGILPLISDPAITVLPNGDGKSQYTGFVLTESAIEYHYLTTPLPRVFQQGLLGNLAAQYSVVKFGAPVAKGASYAHGRFLTVR